LPVDELGVERGGAALQKGGQRQRVVALARHVHVQGAGKLDAATQVRRRRVVHADPVQQQQLRAKNKISETHIIMRMQSVRCNPRRAESSILSRAHRRRF